LQLTRRTGRTLYIVKIPVLKFVLPVIVSRINNSVTSINTNTDPLSTTIAMILWYRALELDIPPEEMCRVCHQMRPAVRALMMMFVPREMEKKAVPARFAIAEEVD
jgi:hypothetical protein